MTDGVAGDGGSGPPWGEGPRAFEELFRSLYGELCSYALGIVGDPGTAEDVVHEVFLNLWEKRGALTLRSSIRAYLFRSVRNRCLNSLKRQAAHRQLAAHHSSDFSAEYALQPDLESADHRARQVARMKSAIASLTPRRRAVIELRWFHGLSHREIAVVLDISVKGVEINLTRALKSLRAALGSEGG